MIRNIYKPFFIKQVLLFYHIIYYLFQIRNSNVNNWFYFLKLNMFLLPIYLSDIREIL